MTRATRAFLRFVDLTRAPRESRLHSDRDRRCARHCPCGAGARFMVSGGSPEGSYTDQRGPECCGSFPSGAIDKLIRRIGILAKYTTAAESSALSGRTASVQIFRTRCLLPETSVFALEADAGDQANAAAIRHPTPGCSFRSSPMPSSHVWPFRNPKSSRPRARHSRQIPAKAKRGRL
jgi:hypothetical protein